MKNPQTFPFLANKLDWTFQVVILGFFFVYRVNIVSTIMFLYTFINSILGFSLSFKKIVIVWLSALSEFEKSRKTMYSKPLITCYFAFPGSWWNKYQCTKSLIETTNTEFSGRAPDCADGITDLSDVTIKSALNTRNDSKNDVFTIARLVDDS